MLSTGHGFRSQSPGCQGFQVLHQHQDLSTSMASRHTIPSLTVQRTLTQEQGYLLIGSGATSSEPITHAFCIIKVAFSHICVLILKPSLVCPVWKRLWTASESPACCSLSLIRSTGMKSYCSNSMPLSIFVTTTKIQRHGFLSG